MDQTANNIHQMNKEIVKPSTSHAMRQNYIDKSLPSGKPQSAHHNRSNVLAKRVDRQSNQLFHFH